MTKGEGLEGRFGRTLKFKVYNLSANEDQCIVAVPHRDLQAVLWLSKNPHKSINWMLPQIDIACVAGISDFLNDTRASITLFAPRNNAFQDNITGEDFARSILNFVLLGRRDMTNIQAEAASQVQSQVSERAFCKGHLQATSCVCDFWHNSSGVGQLVLLSTNETLQIINSTIGQSFWLNARCATIDKSIRAIGRKYNFSQYLPVKWQLKKGSREEGIFKKLILCFPASLSAFQESWQINLMWRCDTWLIASPLFPCRTWD